MVGALSRGPLAAFSGEYPSRQIGHSMPEVLLEEAHVEV